MPPLHLATNYYVFDILLTLKENIMPLHRVNIAIIKLWVTIYFCFIKILFTDYAGHSQLHYRALGILDTPLSH
jgi:hypothetical protein